MFNTTRLIAAGVAFSVIALLGWFLLLPEAPKPPPAASGDEPWPGARALAGDWRLAKDQAYAEGNCRGLDITEYDLTLAAPVKLVPSLSGTMRVRIARTGKPVPATNTLCVEIDRTVTYDVSVIRNALQLLEMTMTATGCTANGEACPLVDRKIFFRPEKDALVFGNDRLTRAP